MGSNINLFSSDCFNIILVFLVDTMIQFDVRTDCTFSILIEADGYEDANISGMTFHLSVSEIQLQLKENCGRK